MTDREKAIVMAYTGTCMLAGDKLGIYYQYIQEKLGHCVMTHELAYPEVQDAIKEAANDDFIELCMSSDEPRVMKLDEVVALQEGKGDVWIEETAMPGIPPWIIAVTLTEKTDWQELGTLWFSDDQCHYVTDYNLNTADGWRCWTSRPTDEQREATAWN